MTSARYCAEYERDISEKRTRTRREKRQRDVRCPLNLIAAVSRSQEGGWEPAAGDGVQVGGRDSHLRLGKPLATHFLSAEQRR